MKDKLKEILTESIKSLEKSKKKDFSDIRIDIKENKEKAFGDYSTNLSLAISSITNDDPKEIAKKIAIDFNDLDFIERVEVAGPGFINFFLSQNSRTEILKDINNLKSRFGKKEASSAISKRILIEYVSSNPTGPLHVGHGRGAAFGSALSSILREVGHEVEEEYYVNDQGRQMDILCISVWLRYLKLFKKDMVFPNNCYKGSYVNDLAEELKKKKSEEYKPKEGIKAIETKLISEMTDEQLDSLIFETKQLLEERFDAIKTFALDAIIKGIKKDLKDFGVVHNLWFKESTLFEPDENDQSSIDNAVNSLEEKKYLYKENGALWFKSTDFGDEKDRVIKRENGHTTYFTSDIAYHSNKYDRGYDLIINIWGADHHGYLPRVNSAMAALGEDIEKFKVVFIQFANLFRGGRKVSMSTRRGEFISLKELIKEVSSEAARFFYLNRKGNQHLDFDLDLAKKETKDNPLYYIQYAHARICSVFSKLQKEKRQYNESVGKDFVSLLNSEKEIQIIQLLSQYSEMLNRSANNFEPHLLCYYLQELAAGFHSYYNEQKILVSNEEELQARLFFLSAIKQVIFNGLKVLGIKAPVSM
tara:strand:- start:975 stop:2741 length:1767 start_codon:yes stop_codon:yes gene_type:complete